MLHAYIKTFIPIFLHNGFTQSYVEKTATISFVLLNLFSQPPHYLYCTTTNTPPSGAAFNWQETATINNLLLNPKQVAGKSRH